MLDRIRALYKDFRRVWRREGLLRAITVSINYVRSNPQLLLLKSPDYQDRRVDNNERWEMMESQIDTNAVNALDVGCNRGEITRRAADKGLFSLGIDRKETIINSARRKTSSPHCHFIQQDIVSEDVERLPHFDVTFLLAVYYHWGKYGWDTAETMLRELANNTNQLFIETPNEFGYIESSRLNNNEEPKDAIQSYLSDVLDSKEISYIGETSYMSGERTDLIFEIKD